MGPPPIGATERQPFAVMHPSTLVFAALLLSLVLVTALTSASHGQVLTNITPDGTLGTTVTPSGNLHNINGGTIRGTNQFHSFSTFTVGTGDVASFNGPGGIQNVLSRVTGGLRSDIDGTLRSTIPGANVFLLNPSGIMFGRNAALDVQGSFHASTADYIRLSDGVRFNATPSPQDALLTTAPPAAFGFLGSNVGQIDVQTGSFDFDTGTFTQLLQVPPGQTFSIVGGNIRLGAPDGAAPAYVLASSGTVNLATAISGEVALGPTGVTVDPAQLGGEINVTGGSIVDAGQIVVRGGRLVIDNASLFPGLFSLAGAALPPDGGRVDVQISNDVTVSGTAIDPLIGAPGGIRTFAGIAAPGDVPDITVETDSLTVSGVAVIQSDRFGPGNHADVVITANVVRVLDGASMSVNNLFAGPGGTLTINAQQMLLSENADPRFTGLAAQSAFHPDYPNGSVDPALTTADGGTITINVRDTLTIRGGAEITTDSFAFGRAGDIIINAGDMLLSRDGAETGSIASQSILAGAGGNTTINATGQITMTGGFLISATTGGSGDGGNVSVTAAGPISLSGTNSGIFSATLSPPQESLDEFAGRFGVDYAFLRQLTADTFGITQPSLFDVLLFLRTAGLIAVDDLTVGNAGRVSVTTPLLSMDAGSRIDSSTFWDGNAGEVVGNLGSLRIGGGAEISSRSGGIPLDEVQIGTGNGGNVSLTASDTIAITGADSTISTTTFGNGNAGSISLTASAVDIQSGGSVTSESGGTLAGQSFVGAGNAGQIALSAPSLTMGGGGTISVATSGGGNAGSISLSVGSLTQAGGARVDSSTSGAGQGGDLTVAASNSVMISGPGTGLFSTASGPGAGGNIGIQAGQLIELSDGGTISAQSTGPATATAGNISIATPTLRGEGGTVTTGATLADGGNISITPLGSIMHLTDSQITTTVQSGVGSGGNIVLGSPLNPFEFIVLSNSGIHADAFGGPGGNVSIFADNLISDQPITLAITASSALSTPGTIDIQANIIDISGDLTQLPEAVLEATALLPASCAARLTDGKTSSLVVAGRGGLPPAPDGVLSMPLPPDIFSLMDDVSGGAPVASPLPKPARALLNATCVN